MNRDQREIQRKLRVLEHADKIGDVSKTCRYFGIGRATFYRWRKAYSETGESGLEVWKLHEYWRWLEYMRPPEHRLQPSREHCA